jgi:S-adenosylmethionine synthetase
MAAAEKKFDVEVVKLKAGLDAQVADIAKRLQEQQDAANKQDAAGKQDANDKQAETE